jgi:hypothetical protein
MASLVDRMKRAAMLDVSLYEEVEHDPAANSQALTVVVLSSVAAGIGALSGGLGSLVLGAVWGLVGWCLWAWLTYFIGTRLLPEPQTEADFGQLLRTLGFASAPGVLRVFGFIPGLGGLVVFAVSLWMLATTVVAVRQALDYKGTGRAVLVCLIGWLVIVTISMLIGGMFATSTALMS